MALCVESKLVKVGPSTSAEPVLVVSTAETCSTYYLVETQDLDSKLSAYEVGLLFGAAASLYAAVFVFKLARRQFGL